MNAQNDVMAALAQLLTSALAQNPTAAAPAAPTESEEVKKARAVKRNALTSEANAIADALEGVFGNAGGYTTSKGEDGIGGSEEDEPGFDAGVILQMASGLAYRARDQYMFSRRNADYHQSRLLAMQAQGAHDSSTSFDMPEINSYESVEGAVRFAVRNMEQYELWLYVARALFERAARVLRAEGREITYIPQFEVSERDFLDYCAKKDADYQSKRRDRLASQTQANHTLWDTANSFVKAG